MAAASGIPTQFEYTYESKTQSERPANNATHLTTASIKNDPNFYWQNSGQERRGAKIWVRATRRKVTPAYKAYLAAEKARREAEFDVLSGLLGKISMATSGSTNNKENNYATSLITGMTRNQRRQAATQAQQLKSEINQLSAMLAASGMEGGKKHRHTKRRHHSKHRHTRRN